MPISDIGSRLFDRLIGTRSVLVGHTSFPQRRRNRPIRTARETDHTFRVSFQIVPRRHRLAFRGAQLGLRDEPRRLLKNVKGVQFVEMENADVCCGFGGTFSVKFPEISAGILDNKIEAIEKADVRTVVSGDASCLMQIGGRLSRLNSKVKTIHLAEILAAQD